MVVTANFRGTTVVVKRALPSRVTATSGSITMSHPDMMAHISESQESADLDDMLRSPSMTGLKRKMTLTNQDGLSAPSVNGSNPSVSPIRPANEFSFDLPAPKHSHLKVTCPVKCSHLLAVALLVLEMGLEKLRN